jgi:NADPH:quinone reductase-like Zn-dependent oxidoreductase
VAIPAAGGPEVLTVIDRPVRSPGADEVRIAVRAAAVNPTDIKLRSAGNPTTPPPWTPGMDLAGTVEMVGASVDRLRIGDAVMAAVSPRRPEGGAQAALVVAPAASVVAIPDGATFEQAASLPMNGLTAKLGLDLLGLTAGQTLAVTGGAGLLASYVIPLAKALDLRVIADAKPEDEELVRGYGADVVVSRGAGFAEAVREVEQAGVDAVYDTATLHGAVFAAIADGGSMAVVSGWEPVTVERGIRVHHVRVSTVFERTDWLEDLRRIASVGGLRLRVAGEYAPEQADEAQRRMEAGGVRGRVVIVF